MKIPSSLKWEATGFTIGEGGQAQVIQVKNKAETNGQVYALKMLSKGKPQKAYERFAREIAAIKSLGHENVIKIYDHSKPEDDFQFYVMEFIPSAMPLKKILAQSSSNFYWKNPLLSLQLFKEILSVLRECENLKIVHRDLSPDNILVLPNGSIKIIDFGICQIENKETITLTEEGVGTPNYMAPECEPHASGTIGIWSDFYSASKVMWSAIAGRFVFSREENVFNSYSMELLFPNAPDIWHLQRIFEKTIRFNTKDRWQTSEEALTVINKVETLIKSGYPTLEQIAKGDCPVCGSGQLKDFNGSHMVFGNPNPRGIAALQCDYCGLCFAFNRDKISENLKIKKELK